MAGSGTSTRRHKRYEVDGVEGTLVVSHDARVLNMSLTGLAVETTSLLKLGSSYWVRLPQGEGELKFKATVSWCRLVGVRRSASGDSGPVYNAGLDFRESLDERARQILVFLQEHVVMEVGERLAGRFRPREEVPAELSGRHPFEVRRLSLTGLLIETPFAPDLGTQLEMELDAPTGPFAAVGVVRYLQPPGDGATDPVPGHALGSPVRMEGGWMVGIEFAELDPAGRERLTRLIQSLLE